MKTINPQFEKYMDHVGHHIVMAMYGDKDKHGNIQRQDVWEVSIECETCCCVLTSEDRGDINGH